MGWLDKHGLSKDPSVPLSLAEMKRVYREMWYGVGATDKELEKAIAEIDWPARIAAAIQEERLGIYKKIFWDKGKLDFGG